ncbi:hypothetical protein Tco_0637855 [Tanacetum coccineum]
MTVDQFAPMVVFRIATMDLASYGVGFKRDGDGFGVMGTVIEVERDRGEGTVELAGKGKKSSSRPSVDTFKVSYIQCRRGLLHFSLSTSGLTISTSTHLRNLYIFKKILSLCRYQVHILDSSNLSLLTSTPTILGLDTSS